MDIELYYQEKGTGEPFIFLHGNGENSSYFGNQINYFQRKYRVIALDTRGHGKSPDAGKNAEMLGLMVNDPNIEPHELSQITMPTLVICGTNDMIKESHTKEIAENLPDAVLTILKGTHFIANKCPAEFNRAVDDFLSQR